MISNTSEGGVWELSEGAGVTESKEELSGSVITVKIICDFIEDTATCFIKKGDGYSRIGSAHKLRFRLDHFTGCRYALSCFSTVSAGGTAIFRDFVLS